MDKELEQPWNSKCSACNDKYSYKGLLRHECTNLLCINYTDKQKALVKEYEKYLKEKLEKERIEKEELEKLKSEFDDNGHYQMYSCNKQPNQIGNDPGDEDEEDDRITIPCGPPAPGTTNTSDPADASASPLFDPHDLDLGNIPVYDDDDDATDDPFGFGVLA